MTRAARVDSMEIYPDGASLILELYGPNGGSRAFRLTEQQARDLIVSMEARVDELEPAAEEEEA